MMLAGRSPRALSVVSSGNAGGYVEQIYGVSENRLRDAHGLIMPVLAGRAAEDVLLGEPSAGASSDLALATEMLGAVDRGGLGGLLTPAQADAGWTEARLRRLYAEALMLVMRHRGAILDLAMLAIERRVLGEAALREFATERGLA